MTAQEDINFLEISTAGTPSNSKVASRVKVVPSLKAYLLDNASSTLSLTFPLSERNRELQMTLEEVPLFPSEGLRVSSNHGTELITNPGKTYRGAAHR